MLDFLRTANFGGIKLGMTRQQLREILGELPDWSVTKRRRRPNVAAIWEYGSIEFYFEEQTDNLCMIFSDHFPLMGCEALDLDPWLLKGGLPLDDALKLLNEANLQSKLVTDSVHTRAVLASSVELHFHEFDCNEGLPPGLTGFSLSLDYNKP